MANTNLKDMIQEIFRFPLKVVAQVLLWVMGWKLISFQQMKTLLSKTKTIYIYPHTSYWDFVIGILYSFAQPEAFVYSWYVMKPQPFNYFGTILRKYGFIPATKREDTNQGFVATTTKQFKDKDAFNLFISPEGTRAANPWHSGYYHLARELNADICVAGLDYETLHFGFKTKHDPLEYHRTTFGRNHHKMEEQMIDINSRLKLEGVLKEDMGSIVPLYPSSSFSCVRAYKTTRWMNMQRSIVGFPYILLYGMFFYCLLGFLLEDF